MRARIPPPQRCGGEHGCGRCRPSRDAAAAGRQQPERRSGCQSPCRSQSKSGCGAQPRAPAGAGREPAPGRRGRRQPVPQRIRAGGGCEERVRVRAGCGCGRRAEGALKPLGTGGVGFGPGVVGAERGVEVRAERGFRVRAGTCAGGVQAGRACAVPQRPQVLERMRHKAPDARGGARAIRPGRPPPTSAHLRMPVRFVRRSRTLGRGHAVTRGPCGQQ